MLLCSLWNIFRPSDSAYRNLISSPRGSFAFMNNVNSTVRTPRKKHSIRGGGCRYMSTWFLPEETANNRTDFLSTMQMLPTGSFRSTGVHATWTTMMHCLPGLDCAVCNWIHWQYKGPFTHYVWSWSLNQLLYLFPTFDFDQTLIGERAASYWRWRRILEGIMYMWVAVMI